MHMIHDGDGGGEVPISNIPTPTLVLSLGRRRGEKEKEDMFLLPMLLKSSTGILTSDNGSVPDAPVEDDVTAAEGTSDFVWTPWTVTQTILIFLATAVFEIGGGWLVWQAVRGQDPRRPWWFALIGSLVLVAYGFWPTLQQAEDTFGRVYAVYGGFFIFGSFMAGWILDGDRPDRGDWIGGSITLGGVLVILFWPRGGESDNLPPQAVTNGPA